MPGVGHLLLRLRASVDDGDVVCFAGAQEALYAALQALLSPNDHAIIVLPNYPAVETLAAQRCQVSGVAVATEDCSLDIDTVAGAIRANTRLIAISFPNNPTGAVLDHARFAALVARCRRHGIWLLSDEVYRLTERDRAAGCRRLPMCMSAAYRLARSALSGRRVIVVTRPAKLSSALGVVNTSEEPVRMN